MIHRLHRLYSFTEGLKKWGASRFTNVGKHFLLIGALAFFFGINVQRSMIYHIFILSSGLLFFSFLLSFRFSSGLKIRRIFPDSCVAGRELRYKIQVENQGDKNARGVFFRESCAEPLPSLSEFQHSKEEGEDKRNIFDRKMLYYRWLWLRRLVRRIESHDQSLPPLASQQKKEIEAVLLPMQRGNIHLQGYTLTRLDPFGLCKREVLHRDPKNLLVLPKLYAVPTLFFDGSRKYLQGGISAAQDHGGSNDFLSLREYVPGDPIKHIDWKSTARQGRGVVKQYRDEYFSRYGLVLDSFSPKRYSAAFEEAVSVAASILVSQDNEHSVLDLLFVGSECVTCSVGRGLGDKKQMMEILASVITCQKKRFNELSSLVKSHSALLSGLVILLIDLDDERQDLINYLTELKVPVKAVLLVEDRQDYEIRRSTMKKLSVPLTVIDCNNVEEQIVQL